MLLTSKTTYFLLILINLYSINSKYCLPSLKHCSECNPYTNLCTKCENDRYAPDKEGGCIPVKSCIAGKNYCSKCLDDETCEECDGSHYPDETGGCALTENCEVSINGKCIKCSEDFLLLGSENNIKICKSLYSSDLKNCQFVNKETGLCDTCEKGFFLTQSDKRCVEIENCFEAEFGVCSKCIDNFFLNKKLDKCQRINRNFTHCEESVDGKTCDKCQKDYYLSEDLKCINTNYCAKVNNTCVECKSGYQLSKDLICTKNKNCEKGNPSDGSCLFCSGKYYLDLGDGKCKSNEDDEEFSFCKIYDDACLLCEKNYYLGSDDKCSSTKYCADSENGICKECIDSYFLGKDKKCSNVENCIYSNEHDECIECKDGYYFDSNEKECKESDDKIFKGCKHSSYDGKHCSGCKKDFYLNSTDNLCYDNSKEGPTYKCSFMTPEYCLGCTDGYYLGYEDKKCSKIAHCKKSEDENTCIACYDYFGLNLGNMSCVDNVNPKEDAKFFFKCLQTNEKGTACEICEGGLEVDENGNCVNVNACEEKDEDGKCKMCKLKSTDYTYFCLNKYYGCVDTYAINCIECDNIKNLRKCTKCKEGFDFGLSGECIDAAQAEQERRWRQYRFPN